MGMPLPYIPTKEEAIAFFNILRTEYPGWSLADIEEFYESNGDYAGLLSIELAKKAFYPQPKQSTSSPTPLSTPEFSAEDIVEKVPKNLPKGVLNRAHYNNILTLYALITLFRLYQKQHKTTHQSQILQAIRIVSKAVSNFASCKKSQQATAAANRIAKKKNIPSPQPKTKYVPAAKVLRSIPQNAYLTYGTKIIDNNLHKKEIWSLDYFSETQNEYCAQRMATTRKIAYSVLKKLAPFIDR